MKQRELNAALFALVLAVSRHPEVRAEIDDGLPEDSQTAAVLAEIHSMVRSGAVDVKRGVEPRRSATTDDFALPKARKAKNVEPRPCRQCGEVFVPAVANGRYCSDSCSRQYWANREKAKVPVTEAGVFVWQTPRPCDVCGDMFTPIHSVSKTCSADCKKKRLAQISKSRYEKRNEKRREDRRKAREARP